MFAFIRNARMFPHRERKPRQEVIKSNVFQWKVYYKKQDVETHTVSQQVSESACCEFKFKAYGEKGQLPTCLLTSTHMPWHIFTTTTHTHTYPKLNSVPQKLSNSVFYPLLLQLPVDLNIRFITSLMFIHA